MIHMRDATARHTVPGAERVDLVVGLTTSIQAAISYGLLSIPVASVFYAADFGLPAWVIGFQISAIYVVGTFSSLFSANVLRRYGGARTSQIALVAMAIGAICILAGTVPMLALGLAMMGVAYGLPNPAASHILRRYTPEERRNFLFSIKQGGVPIGGTLGGVATAYLAHHAGWQVAMAAPATACLLLAAILQIVRNRWDGDRIEAAHIFEAPWSKLAETFRYPRFTQIFSAGVLLAASQLCVGTFVILLLIHDMGINPVQAGVLVSLVQGAGIFGRVGMGWLADRVRSGLRVLITLAVVLALLTVLLALTHPPVWLLVPLLIGIGTLSSGWSGVLIAEADRTAPPENASAATATLLCGTFFGVVTSTITFSLLVPVLGTYRSPFLMIAAGCLIAALLLRNARRSESFG